MNSSDLLVLDTHIWVWWVSQDGRLAHDLREVIIKAGRVCVSASSVYELVQAVVRGRLKLTLPISEWLECATRGAGIEVIPVDAQIAEAGARLPQVHGDPLDRLIIATAVAYRARLMSQDGKFSGYPELDDLLIAHG